MRLYILFFLKIFLFSSISLSSEKKLILGLDWFINPDHAPIIIADKYGYFNDEDLKVEIIEPADPNDPPKQVAAGKIIVKTMQGSISELNIDDKSEIVFPPEKYLDLDAEDFQRMIGQKVHLAVGSRPNGQKAIDHIDVLLGEHDEPQHEGGHPPVPNGNAPFPQR